MLLSSSIGTQPPPSTSQGIETPFALLPDDETSKSILQFNQIVNQRPSKVLNLKLESHVDSNDFPLTRFRPHGNGHKWQSDSTQPGGNIGPHGTDRPIKNSWENELLIKTPDIVGKHDLWTSKYRPRNTSEIVGNHYLIGEFRRWLLNWNKRFLKFAKTDRCHNKTMQTSHLLDNGDKKAALLSGPPGVGKTVTAIAVGQDLGFELIEINASDSSKRFETGTKHPSYGGSAFGKILDLTQNTCLSLQPFKPVIQRNVILVVDEIDGMTMNNEIDLKYVVDMIQRSKIPIIFICNDRYNKKIQPLLKCCKQFNFQKPLKEQVFKKISQILREEGLNMDQMTMTDLLESVDLDIRQALNQLQECSENCSLNSISFSIIGKKYLSALLYQNKITFNRAHDSQTMEKSKDVNFNAFSAVDKLFSGCSRKQHLESQIQLVLQDPELISLFIQENYLNYGGCRKEKVVAQLDKIVLASSSLSLGDIAFKFVERKLRWDFLSFACIQSAVACACLVRGFRGPLLPNERNYNRYPAWLSNFSATKSYLRMLSSLLLHLLSSGNFLGNKQTLRLEFMPVFCHIMTIYMQEAAKEEKDLFGKLLQCYSLSVDNYYLFINMSCLKAR